MTPSRPVLVADRYQLDSDLVARSLSDVSVRTCRPDELRDVDRESLALVLVDANLPADLFDELVARGCALGLLHDGRVPRDRLAHHAVRLLSDRREVRTTLADAVARVLDGGLHRPSPRPADGSAPSLSPRESEVLALLAQGLKNRDIADKLAISPHTVRTHVQALLTKLNRANRVAAVGAARQAGLLSG